MAQAWAIRENKPHVASKLGRDLPTGPRRGCTMDLLAFCGSSSSGGKAFGAGSSRFARMRSSGLESPRPPERNTRGHSGKASTQHHVDHSDLFGISTARAAADLKVSAVSTIAQLGAYFTHLPVIRLAPSLSKVIFIRKSHSLYAAQLQYR